MATKGGSGVESTQRAVLFADVCDSTALYESLGDAPALSLINVLFEKLGMITSTHEGTVIKTLGDAVVCQFKDGDKAFRAAEGELDPVKRAALFIHMNDLACQNQAVIPVVYRPRVAAISSKLRAHISGWDTDMGDLKDWYREA